MTRTTSNPIYCQQQGGLRQLALVVAILTVADGTDGEHHPHVGTAGAQQVDSLLQNSGTLIDRKQLFLEKALRPFLAVVYNLAGGFLTIDVIGA